MPRASGKWGGGRGGSSSVRDGAGNPGRVGGRGGGRDGNKDVVFANEEGDGAIKKKQKKFGG